MDNRRPLWQQLIEPFLDGMLEALFEPLFRGLCHLLALLLDGI